MNKKSLKSYGARTDKSMKTVVRLEKTSLKITNFTVNYLSKHNLTFNQFKVLIFICFIYKIITIAVIFFVIGMLVSAFALRAASGVAGAAA